MKAISRIKKVVKNTDSYFEGYYKKHHIMAEKESNSIYEPIFYIQVINEDGCYLYDGYWYGDNNLDVTIEKAIEEALEGARLI